MKPVLVHYINIGNLDPMDIRNFMETLKDEINYNDEYHSVFLPVRNQDSKVECLNPIFFEEGKEKRILKNRLNGISYKMNELIDRMPYINKNLLLTERTIQ
jgi:hypothetical protein